MANESPTYCLLCAKLKTSSEVIDVEEKIDEIIFKLTRINANAHFHSINLPKRACLKCLSTLEGAYDFVITVERAQHALLDLKLDIKQEICADFITTNTSVKVELELENVDVAVDKNPLKYEVNSPASSTDETPADTSISNTVDEKENATTKTSAKSKGKHAKQKCKNKKSTSLNNPRSTWEEYIWKCGVCDTEFSTHEELKTHAMEFHKCCNAQKCYDCNIRKGSLDQFNKHVQQTHRKQYSYSCYLCFKTFPTPCKARLHRDTHRLTPHYCKGCNTTFETENQLNDHMTTYYRLQIRKQPKTDYICETCGKSFVNKANLIAHTIVHTDLRPYPCTKCPRRFKYQNQLNLHLQLHIAENLYTCDVCNRSFKLKQYLKNHQIVHTNLLPHVCPYCNKGFRFKTILNQHLRQHTGDKPYSCTVCEHQFTNWPNYNKHMKRRHNMNMSKRKPVPTSNKTSETVKE